MLHRTVRCWAGEHVALLAELIFALTPVTAVINRDTNPDTPDLLGAGAVLVASSMWWVALVGLWPGPKPGAGAGITRLFGEQVGGQISWLLPLCLLILAAVAIAGLRQMRSGIPADPARRAGWVLWGGWLLLVGLVLSVAQGIFQRHFSPRARCAADPMPGAAPPGLRRR
ncbi:MAG: hypothetical protein ACRDRO_08235 [Pseudonocardiaceae bacterium]